MCARVASILPTCDLPFPIPRALFFYFEISTPRYVNWWGQGEKEGSNGGSATSSTRVSNCCSTQRYWVLRIAYQVLRIVYCVLCIVYCVLCTVYCVLCIAYCVSCIAYCVLCIVCCVPGIVYCVVCIVYCVLCIVYCVLCIVAVVVLFTLNRSFCPTTSSSLYGNL